MISFVEDQEHHPTNLRRRFKVSELRDQRGRENRAKREMSEWEKWINGENDYTLNQYIEQGIYTGTDSLVQVTTTQLTLTFMTACYITN